MDAVNERREAALGARLSSCRAQGSQRGCPAWSRALREPWCGAQRAPGMMPWATATQLGAALAAQCVLLAASRQGAMRCRLCRCSWRHRAQPSGHTPRESMSARQPRLGAPLQQRPPLLPPPAPGAAPRALAARAPAAGRALRHSQRLQRSCLIKLQAYNGNALAEGNPYATFGACSWIPGTACCAACSILRALRRCHVPCEDVGEAIRVRPTMDRARAQRTAIVIAQCSRCWHRQTGPAPARAGRASAALRAQWGAVAAWPWRWWRRSHASGVRHPSRF
jgi:hypothetical protein